MSVGMRISIPFALAALLALGAAPAAAGDPARTVTVKTADGLSLEADWYPGEEGMPGVVGLHMYGADRTTWAPLADKRPAGWHFLALDLRGHGKSAAPGGKDLSKAVKQRDPALFLAMWQDAIAGVEWLKAEAKCDARRIGLVGASVGCSVAIDATVRKGLDVAAVCALTPGTDYLGVPSLEHAKSWRDRHLLLLSSVAEADGGARPLADLLRRNPRVAMRLVPGEEIHGTRMFGKVPGIEDRITAWLEGVLGCQILDGEIDAVERRDPGPRGWSKTFEGTLEKSLSVRADALGLNVQGEGTFGTTFALFVDPAGEEDAWKPGAKRLRGAATFAGNLVAGWVDTWSGAGWGEVALGGPRPDVAKVTDRALEFRIPWSVLGVLPKGGRARVGFKVFLRKQDWTAAPETWKDSLGTVVEVPRWDPEEK
jgi:pimeloyl-ACP methyl ester carboxylesterase